MTTTKYVIEFKVIGPTREHRKWHRCHEEYDSPSEARKGIKRFYGNPGLYLTRIVQIYQRERVVR